MANAKPLLSASRRGSRKFERVEEGGDQGDREADDVEVVAFDAGNPAGGAALDGVGSGFVHGLAGGDVDGDLLFGERAEGDGGGFGGDLGGGCGDKGDAGDDLMGAGGEETQHAGGVGGIGRFAEDVVVKCDDGVGGKHREGCD